MKQSLLVVMAASLAFLSGCSAATTEASSTTQAQDETPKIVSLNPSSTEILFAVGAGEYVVAADSYSDYPVEAPSESDLDAFALDLETILEWEPSHVILGVANPEITEALEGFDVEVVTQPTPVSMDEVYSNIRFLGELTSQSEEAEEAVGEIEDSIEAAKLTLGDSESRRIYHEVAAAESNQGYYTNYQETFIGDLYSQLGFLNVAKASNLTEGIIDPEVVLQSDPEVIVLAGPLDQDAIEFVSNRPGWAEMTAVRRGDVLVADRDHSSRGGPRLVNFIEALIDGLS